MAWTASFLHIFPFQKDRIMKDHRWSSVYHGSPMIFLPGVAKWQVVVHLPKWPAVREGAGKLPRGAAMKLQAAQKVIYLMTKQKEHEGMTDQMFVEVRMQRWVLMRSSTQVWIAKICRRWAHQQSAREIDCKAPANFRCVHTSVCIWFCIWKQCTSKFWCLFDHQFPTRRYVHMFSCI